MKTKLLLCATLLSLTVMCFGQQDSTVDNWSWLMGEWKGEGIGNPGQGGGTFSFAYDLDKNIIIRKSHSEYSATDKKPKIIHEDLMIVYFDDSKSPSNAIYFDNEGHIINYTITYAEKSITFTSNKLANTPIFRLTYLFLEKDLVNTKFEMSQDGVNFMTYIEGKSKKTK